MRNKIKSTSLHLFINHFSLNYYFDLYFFNSNSDYLVAYSSLIYIKDCSKLDALFSKAILD